MLFEKSRNKICLVFISSWVAASFKATATENKTFHKLEWIQTTKKQEEKSNLRSYQAYCSHYWLLTLMACSRRHHHCCCCCCCCVQLVLLIYSCFSIHSFLPGSWKCINHCQTILLLFHDENVCVAMLHKSTNMHAHTWQN